MQDPRGIKVLFVDFDGTLVDSLPLLYSAYLEFLERFGKKGSKEEFESLNGPTLEEVLEVLKKRYHLPHTSDRLYEEYLEVLYHHYTQNLKLFAGARSFLSYIHTLGIPMVLVTATKKRLADAFLEAEGLDKLFDKLVTGDGKILGKPSPDLYNRALFLMEASPEEAVAIEDSPKGVQAALSAGIFTLQINHDKSPLVGSVDQSYLQVSDWHEMLDLFKVWYE